MKNRGLQFVVKVLDQASKPFAEVSKALKTTTRAADDAARSGAKTVSALGKIGSSVSGIFKGINSGAKALENLGWEKATGSKVWQKLPGHIKAGSVALASFKSSGKLALQSLQQLGDGIETVGKKMEALENIASVAQTMSGVGNDILAKVWGGVKPFASEQTMVTDIGINSELSPKQKQELHNNAKAIAKRQNVKTTDVLGVIGPWAAQSGNADEAQAVAEPIVLAAKATGTSTEDMGRAAYAMMKGLNISAKDLAGTLDIVAYGAKQGGFEFKDMAQFMPNMIASANALGITGQKGAASLTAAFQIAKDKGQDASTAANNISNLLSAMGSPELAKRFKDVAGIDLRKSIADGAKEGKDALQVVIEQMSKLSEADKNKFGDLFGDKESRNGIMALVNGAKEYNRIRDESLSGNSKDTVKKDAAARDKDLESSLKKLDSAKTRIGSAFGNALAPLLAPLADLALKVAGMFETFATSNAGKVFAIIFAGIGLVISGLGALLSGLITVGGGVLSFMMLGAPVMSMLGAIGDLFFGVFSGAFAIIRGGIGIFGTFGKTLFSFARIAIPLVLNGIRAIGLAMAANPIIAIIAVIAIIVTLIIMNWSKLKPYFMAFWNWLKGITAKAIGALKAIWTSFKTTISNLWQGIVAKVTWAKITMFFIILRLVQSIKNIWSGVSSFFSGIWDGIAGFCKSAMDKILGWIQGPIDFLKKAWEFAQGIANTPPPTAPGGGGFGGGGFGGGGIYRADNRQNNRQSTLYQTNNIYGAQHPQQAANAVSRNTRDSRFFD